MNFKKIIPFLISSIVIYSSCDYVDKRLRLFNDTKKSFYVELKKDTILQMKDVEHQDEQSTFNVMRANDTCFPLFAFKNHGGYIRKINEECIDSTMFLYLFEMDSVKKYGWGTIIKNKRMFIRRGFKVKELNDIKWFIKISSI